MQINESINETKIGFENSFAEGDYYNLQTQDKKHLDLILNSLIIKADNTILDLGTGSGYLAFPMAKRNFDCKVIGLDIVEKTLEINNQTASNEKIENLEFIVYDGVILPFEDNSVDVVVTRYALHHFPMIESTFKEISRILKPNGQLFISDPIPNEVDTMGFVDLYMQTKSDGHIKFYTQNELITLSKNVGLYLDKMFMTSIRFPRKEADNYRELLTQYQKEIIDGYDIKIIGDEIFITEQVVNLSFIKK